MKTAFGIFVVLFFALFLITGAIGLVGAILGLTFGILGTVTGVIWNIVFHPVVLVIIIAVLAYQLHKRSRYR